MMILRFTFTLRMFLDCVVNVGLKVPKIYFSLLIFRNKEARCFLVHTVDTRGTGYVGSNLVTAKHFTTSVISETMPVFVSLAVRKN